MNILRKGSKGPQVGALQSRLNEIYEEQIAVDNDFGPHTEEMVSDFQETMGLSVDGVVGPATWRALFEEAQEVPETPVPAVMTESQLLSLFGKPRDPVPYLVVLDFQDFKSVFAHVKDYLGKAWSCRMYAHKLMEAPLRQAFKNLVDRGFNKELRTFDGCVCVRPKSSGNGWSTHAWGLAVDFNAGTNGYGRKPTLSAGFVKCFVDAGFEWGGGWSTPDGMHFQLPRTRG